MSSTDQPIDAIPHMRKRPEESRDDYIRRVVETAPPPTPEVRDRLRMLMKR